MKIKKEIDVCDFCELDVDNVLKTLSVKQCDFCNKHICDSNNCKGKIDEYIYNGGLPHDLRRFAPTICKECLKKAHKAEPERYGDARCSGNSWACALADNFTKKHKEINNEITEYLKIEIQKCITASKK